MKLQIVGMTADNLSVWHDHVTIIRYVTTLIHVCVYGFVVLTIQTLSN